MLAKVKMCDSIASSEGWIYVHGQVVEVDAALAEKWIASGIAQYDGAPMEYDTAVVNVPEIAIAHKAKRKR